MNCPTFRTIVHEIDQRDGLEESTLDAALGHAQSCTRCARQLYQVRELAASLRALASADEPPPSTQNELRLVRAFRARADRRPRWKRVGGWAVAAALALAAGAGLLWHYASARAREARVPAQAALRAARPLTLSPLSRAAGPPVTPAPHNTPARRIAAGQLQVQPGGTGNTGEFMALPFADNDEPLESAELVRIRLSESDLELLGLPVAEEASAGPLTADVVIGEDGEPRAIRFVPE